MKIVNNLSRCTLSYEIDDDSIGDVAFAQGEGVLSMCIALSLACRAIEMMALNLWYSK
jgi:hypothetical protein